MSPVSPLLSRGDADVGRIDVTLAPHVNIRCRELLFRRPRRGDWRDLDGRGSRARENPAHSWPKQIETAHEQDRWDDQPLQNLASRSERTSRHSQEFSAGNLG